MPYISEKSLWLKLKLGTQQTHGPDRHPLCLNAAASPYRTNLASLWYHLYHTLFHNTTSLEIVLLLKKYRTNNKARYKAFLYVDAM